MLQLQTGPRQQGLRRRQILSAALVFPLLGRPDVALASGAAQRLVCLDWAAAEMVSALGIAPLAVSDIATFRQWLPYNVLPGGVLDIGSRVEPNRELLTSLQPDAILISNWQKSQMSQLEGIAPVWPVTIVGTKSDPLGNAMTEMLTLGERLGKADQAERFIHDAETEIAACAARLRAAALPPVIVGVLHENGSQLFLYGQGSWVHSLLLALGLTNALARPVSGFGNALVDLSALADRPDAVLLYLDQGARTRRAERVLRRSSLWQRLPMVAERRVSAIPSFYPLGGLPSVRYAARAIGEALLLFAGTVRDG